MTSGCVVPIAPEFEDEPNYPPYILESRPLIGEEISGPPNGSVELSVTVGDPNVRDRLYVRWIFDYPRYDTDTSRIAEGTRVIEPTGDTIRSTLPPFEPSCRLHPVARGLTQHRLVLVVSDRDFLDADERSVPPETPLDAVPEDAGRVHAVWLLDMECK